MFASLSTLEVLIKLDGSKKKGLISLLYAMLDNMDLKGPLQYQSK